MKRRQWTSKQKAQVVLEGLSGQIDITAPCQKHQISQTQYYKWRDSFLQNCHQTFEIQKQSKKEQHLENQVTKLQRLRARRGPMRSKPRSHRPNHFWGIDMTKIKIYPWGWLYLCIVLDWCTKEIVGYSLSIQSKTDDWLTAVEMAVNNRFPDGIREHLKDQSLFLISDNGCQPTSQRFMMNCSLLGIKQIFTTWSNPEGNSDTERVLRTLKEDLVWTYDWDNPFSFAEELGRWIERYNTDYPHQALNNNTPRQYFESFNKEPVLT